MRKQRMLKFKALSVKKYYQTTTKWEPKVPQMTTTRVKALKTRKTI
jgi:hypothetical protein